MYTRIYGSAIEEPLRAELHRELERRIAAVNRQWATGEYDPQAEPVAEDFQGVQYAPWYEGETFAADRAGWIEGSRAAAAAGKGKDWHWTVRDAAFYPRSVDETIAVYTVVHRFGREPVPPGEAVFLETWVRLGGRWHLRRHTAEKR